MTSEWLVVVGERDEMELFNGQRYPDTFEHPTVWDGVKDGKSEQWAIKEIFPNHQIPAWNWEGSKNS